MLRAFPNTLVWEYVYTYLGRRPYSVRTDLGVNVLAMAVLGPAGK